VAESIECVICFAYMFIRLKKVSAVCIFRFIALYTCSAQSNDLRSSFAPPDSSLFSLLF
jgi:hypothetical protein